MNFTDFLKMRESSRLVMTLYENYKNLSLDIYKISLKRVQHPRLLRAGSTKRQRSGCFADVRNSQEKQPEAHKQGRWSGS